MPPPKPKLDAQRLQTSELYRQQARQAFDECSRQTNGKDVLERCKRLNEFLEMVSACMGSASAAWRA